MLWGCPLLGKRGLRLAALGNMLPLARGREPAAEELFNFNYPRGAYGARLAPGMLDDDLCLKKLPRVNQTLFLQLEGKGSQRWQLDEDGMSAAHPGNVFGLGTAKISNVTSAVRFGIGVDELAIETRLGDA